MSRKAERLKEIQEYKNKLNDLSGYSKEELNRFQDMAKVIAFGVRNNIEDFHANNLSDTQMKELNPLIRDAIYTAILRIDRASKGDKICAELLSEQLRFMPPYWEDCKLT